MFICVVAFDNVQYACSVVVDSISAMVKAKFLVGVVHVVCSIFVCHLAFTAVLHSILLAWQQYVSQKCSCVVLQNVSSIHEVTLASRLIQGQRPRLSEQRNSRRRLGP